MRSTIAVLAFAMVVVVAQSQVLIPDDLGFVIKGQKKSPPPKSTPFEPSGFPASSPPQEEQLPPIDPAKDRRLKIKHAQETKKKGDLVTAKGNVNFTYKGYEGWADQVQGDLGNDVFILEGHARLIGSTETVTGDAIQVNFRNRTYRFITGSAIAKPGRTQGRLLSDLFIKGASGSGSRKESDIELSDLTTCDLEFPHYDIRARHTNVKPGKRAILEDADIRLFGRSIFRIPYLIFPLDDLSHRYTPEFGKSDDEGYFMKNRFGMPFPGDSAMYYRVDYFEKLGAGLGADYFYDTDTMRGKARLYGITGGPRSMQGSLEHEMKLGRSRFSFDGSYQRNNYLTAPASTNSQGRSQLVIPQKFGTTTRLSYFRSFSESGSFNSVSETYGLQDDRTINSLFSTNLSLNLIKSSSNGTSSSVSREQLDANFKARQDLKRAVALLEYQRSIPIGNNDNFFNTSDRTPVLTIDSDAQRILGQKRGRWLPFQTELSIGELVDGSSKQRITRTMFDFSYSKSSPSDKRAGISSNGRFRQGLYSDDTAQYSLNFGSQFRYRLGKATAFNLGYSYLRPYGFTPLDIDRSGEVNSVRSDVSYAPIRSLVVGAETSYDILQLKRSSVPWQQVGIRVEWNPKDTFQLRTNASYDPFNATWANVRFDLGWRIGETFVSAGARYDASRHTWGNANIYIDGLRYGKLKSNVLLAYNGYLSKFETAQFMAIYDLHCWEAVFQYKDTPTGFRSGREISFFVRLKALPSNTNFGTGRRGQGYGTGTGIGF